MILFLYGEDSYRTHRQLREIRSKFLRDVDPTGLNLIELDADKADVGEAAAAARSAGFLSDRRLVVLKGFVKAMKSRKAQDKALAELCDGVPEETILVFHELCGSDDLGKTETFKRLRKERFYPEFSSPAPKQVQGWVKQEAKTRGFDFTRGGLRAYLAVAGTDLWKVASELDKFAAHAGATGSDIDESAVSDLSDARIEANLFEFLDMIGARRPDRAAEILEGLLVQGESEVMLISRLQSHFRALLVASDIASTEKVKKDRIVRELGVHPFVATKVLSQMRYFRRDELADIYGWLIEADIKLKTGGWPKPRMAIDMLLMRLAGETAT